MVGAQHTGAHGGTRQGLETTDCPHGHHTRWHSDPGLDVLYYQAQMHRDLSVVRPIIEQLEAIFPSQSIYPPSTVARFIANLLEEFADGARLHACHTASHA